MPGELKNLEDMFSTVYLVKDPYILKLLLAGVVSQRLQADPVWFIIVGPSSSSKTEYINAIANCQGVLSLSTLTSKTFVSGMRGPNGKDASLLVNLNLGTPQEGNGIIAFKDMTSLLSERSEDRAVIMGQLREIYDGKYAKTFGTGHSVNWKGKITIIAGSTYAIHQLKQTYAAMGERFLMYNLITPDGIESARRAMQNQEDGHMAEHRARLSEATKDYVDNQVKIPDTLPKIDLQLKEEILVLAELATRARSDVQRNWASPTKEILDVNPPEMPARFASQLQTFAMALMVLNLNETGVADLLDSDKLILYRLALDSITRSRRKAMQALAIYDTIETTGLAVKLALPTTSVRLWLEDLVALEVAEREKGSGPKGDKWKIKSKYKEVILKFEQLKPEGGELTEYKAENIMGTEEQLIAEALEAQLEQVAVPF